MGSGQLSIHTSFFIRLFAYHSLVFTLLDAHVFKETLMMISYFYIGRDGRDGRDGPAGPPGSPGTPGLETNESFLKDGGKEIML